MRRFSLSIVSIVLVAPWAHAVDRNNYQATCSQFSDSGVCTYYNVTKNDPETETSTFVDGDECTRLGGEQGRLTCVVPADVWNNDSEEYSAKTPMSALLSEPPPVLTRCETQAKTAASQCTAAEAHLRNARRTIGNLQAQAASGPTTSPGAACQSMYQAVDSATRDLNTWDSTCGSQIDLCASTCIEAMNAVKNTASLLKRAQEARATCNKFVATQAAVSSDLNYANQAARSSQACSPQAQAQSQAAQKKQQEDRNQPQDPLTQALKNFLSQNGGGNNGQAVNPNQLTAPRSCLDGAYAAMNPQQCLCAVNPRAEICGGGDYGNADFAQSPAGNPDYIDDRETGLGPGFDGLHEVGQDGGGVGVRAELQAKSRNTDPTFTSQPAANVGRGSENEHNPVRPPPPYYGSGNPPAEVIRGYYTNNGTANPFAKANAKAHSTNPQLAQKMARPSRAQIYAQYKAGMARGRQMILGHSAAPRARKAAPASLLGRPPADRRAAAEVGVDGVTGPLSDLFWKVKNRFYHMRPSLID